VLALEGVHRTYRGSGGAVAALRGVDLALDASEYLVLEGASGAGKSTLLTLAGLLEPPDLGRVLFEGRDVARLSPRELSALRLRRIGFVFQHHYLVPDLTLAQNVALPALALGARDSRARVDALLARMGLDAARDRLPRELSGGEQQRAGVARALVNAPRLVLADEPTGNLDPAIADEVARLLADAHAAGAAVMVVTHDPARFPHATRRARLERGRLTA